MSGFFALTAVRMAVKSVALSVVNCVSCDRAARRLDGLGELLGDALAVGRAVVDGDDRLALQLLDGVAAQRAAQMDVVGDDAERRLEALAGVLRVGRRRRDLRDAGVAVDLRRGDRGARVQVADDAVDLGVDELVGDRGALLRIAGVVFGDELELRLLAADGDALGVQLVDGHAGAVLVVLAEVGDAAARRGDVADLDDHVLRRHGAGEDRCGGRGDQVQLDLHANTSGFEMESGRDRLARNARR